jgi:hypothetical protein
VATRQYFGGLINELMQAGVIPAFFSKRNPEILNDIHGWMCTLESNDTYPPSCNIQYHLAKYVHSAKYIQYQVAKPFTILKLL